METSPLGQRQNQKQSALSQRAAEVVSIDVHLSRLRSARSTLSGLRRIQGHGDGCSDYCSPSSAANHGPKVLQLTHPRPAGLNCCAAAEAYWALDSRPSTILINLWRELLRGAEWRAATGTSRLANWIADAPSLPMSRYSRWWADATTHRTRSSGWEDRSWSTSVLVPSWHALSAIRVRLTAYMYACMTRMRYVTGHSCSLEIFWGCFFLFPSTVVVAPTHVHALIEHTDDT